MMPRRIQRRCERGWRKPEGAVIVDRTSRFGNPFRIGGLIREPAWDGGPACPLTDLHPESRLPEGHHDGYTIRRVADAADATELFRRHVEFYDDIWTPEALAPLAGRDLVCFCRVPDPGEPDHCHAAVLLTLANPGSTR